MLKKFLKAIGSGGKLVIVKCLPIILFLGSLYVMFRPITNPGVGDTLLRGVALIVFGIMVVVLDDPNDVD